MVFLGLLLFWGKYYFCVGLDYTVEPHLFEIQGIAISVRTNYRKFEISSFLIIEVTANEIRIMEAQIYSDRQVTH
jgi:hypothetical protein